MADFDLLIIGAGSGNSIIGPEHDDWNVAIAERGAFGGTCLNVGCIPSKMFVYAAEVAAIAQHGPALGVHTSFDRADWTTIRDRVFGRIDPMAAGGREYRLGLDHVTVFEEAVHCLLTSLLWWPGPELLDLCLNPLFRCFVPDRHLKRGRCRSA